MAAAPPVRRASRTHFLRVSVVRGERHAPSVNREIVPGRREKSQVRGRRDAGGPRGVWLPGDAGGPRGKKARGTTGGERICWVVPRGLAEGQWDQFAFCATCEERASSSIHWASTSSGTGARVAVIVFSAPSRRTL
jgi:hypothetical protein